MNILWFILGSILGSFYLVVATRLPRGEDVVKSRSKCDSCGKVLKWYNLSIEGGLTMPTIIPIKELKNTSTISDICHSVNEPIFITKNGYGDMVLMSMETYENYIHRQQIYRELEISEQQIIDGKTMDAKDSVKKLREKYGI